jgi:histidinol phosphatase-like enzyme (inositol monophosphatase family)
VRQEIAGRFPADGVLGEEQGETNPGAARRWIVDPIDGTRSFVHGVPLYAVLLALEEEGQPVLGVVHFPALGETVYAAAGHGCWYNGRPAHVSDVDSMREACVATSDARLAAQPARAEGWARLAAAADVARTWGDAYGYALVATGRAEVMVDPEMHIWDAAAVAVIVREAGGVFTDWRGTATHTGGCGVGTNAALAGEVRTILGEG